MFYIYTNSHMGYRQFMPFIEYFEKKDLKYLCFYEGELDVKEKNEKIKQGNFLKAMKLANNCEDDIYFIAGTFINLLKSMAIKKVISSKSYLIFRTRGIVPEESYLRNDSKLRYKILSWIEKYCLKKSDFILAVSQNQKEHYMKKYKITKDKFFVIHNFLNHWQYEFKAVSKQDTPCIVYVGSYSKWQRVDDIFKLFKKIEERLPNVSFVVYTPRTHIQTFNKLAKENNIKLKVESHDYRSLIDKVSSMTLGIIMRNDDIINRVSSPFKIIDYISAGIPFIMTDNIGDYPSIFKKVDFVDIIKDKYSYSQEDIDSIVEFINKNLLKNNNEIIRFAKDNLDFSRELSQFILSIRGEMVCK